MKQHWGKWLVIALLVIFLIIVIRGYIIQSQDAKDDAEIRQRLSQTRLNNI